MPVAALFLLALLVGLSYLADVAEREAWYRGYTHEVRTDGLLGIAQLGLIKYRGLIDGLVAIVVIIPLIIPLSPLLVGIAIITAFSVGDLFAGTAMTLPVLVGVAAFIVTRPRTQPARTWHALGVPALTVAVVFAVAVALASTVPEDMEDDCTPSRANFFLEYK